MIRSEIKKLVMSIPPLDAMEAEQIAFVERWIDSGAEIFRIAKPATPDPHLVSYFVLIDAVEQKLLLVDHKKANLWLPAGGHVEPNEHPQETVAREIVEELGIDAEFILDQPFFLTVTPTTGEKGRHTDVSLWYLVKGNAAKTLEYDAEEFHDIRWFAPDEIPLAKSDPHMRRLIEKLVLHQFIDLR